MKIEVRGIKRIGHILKGMLPSSTFMKLLSFYHSIVKLLAVPKAMYSRKKVSQTLTRLRRSNGKIRFGFYVVLDSMFQMRHVYELMLADDRFEPFIVVVPRIGYQVGDMQETVNRTYESLVRDFGPQRVFKGLDNGLFDNHIGDCDACTMMNLYRGLADSRFETQYFAMRGVPIFGAPYFYVTGTVHTPEYYGMPSLKYIHSFFCSNETEREYFNRYQKKNKTDKTAIVTGCVKTDSIRHGYVGNSKKTILIAPHHSAIKTVDSGFNIGNFFKYKDFFKTLPSRYPDIYWIFRPHPHLKVRLIKEAGWTAEQWDEYIAEFTSTSNAVYESGGAYYDSFARSDAMIQDCSSFLPEYYYTGKPQCYLLASEEMEQQQFDDFGRSLVDHTYRAYSESDITSFIEDVVLTGGDYMRDEREIFAREKVIVNYPHASETALEIIAETLGRGKKR